MNRLAALVLVPLLVVGCTSSKAKSTGSVSTTGDAAAQSAAVDLTASLSFVPNSSVAKVGTVNFTVDNTGQVPHNMEFDDKALGKTKTVDGKTSAVLKVVFDKAGTFTFRCTFHPGMTGKVVVS